ncbi:MAG: ABC transporter substrate-binding protein [Desulfobacterales bacterium]|nr:ABC transporter substrate-binding protein [Desulfobacterales bacterium]
MKKILFCFSAFMLALSFLQPSVSPCFADNKELVLALKGEPDDGFNPVMGWGRYGHPLFQSTLLARDNDLNIVNDLATQVRLDEQRTCWYISIRRDAVFSDGKPLTAKDVAFTFNTAAKSGGKADLSNLEKAVATGDYRLEIRLKRPDSTFINRLITLGIVPEHAYDDGYGRNPLGSGPFVMKNWVEGEQLIAVANPLYYGKKPFFKRLVFLYAKEDTMLAAAKAGKVDMVVVPAHLGKQKIKNMTVRAVKSVDNRGMMFPMVKDEGKTSPSGAPIGNTVTSDPAVRKAVNLAVNRKALVEGVLEGYGRPAFFVCDNLPWDNADNRLSDNDKAGAQALLKNAGWKDADNDGVLEKNGVEARFTLVYPSDRAVRQGLALAVADMLSPVGIKVDVLGKSWDDIKKRMHSDVILFGWGSHDPMEIYHLYHSSLAGQGWFNAGYYKNSTVDGYLDKAVNAKDFETSLTFWKKAQWDGKTGCGPKGDAPWAWLVNLDHIYFMKDDLDIGQSRIEPHGHGWPITANITEWKRR